MAVKHKDLDSDLVRIDTLLASISSANIRVVLHSPSGLIVSAIGAFFALLNAFVFLLSLLRLPTRELQVKKLKGKEVVMEKERKTTYQCEKKSTANALDITLLVFSSLALLMLIVGFLLPDWLYIRYKDGASQVSTLHMSIWYNILCPSNLETCEGASYGNLDKKLIDMNNPGCTR
ncbi:hypothetical protein CHS0354_004782 [Potamilus streckersoni]|uniref:Uncharacterized protein n=1 Tax=Potamilus streckersoni TaxID=2493646 RepID=A0AAE0TD35_9BIVA|nr:hypothetical protein CHS0354_004782 [Potamilus streckersoni]